MDALIPADFGLVLDPSTRVARAGRILIGGTPFRLVRLSNDHAAALAAWRQGEPVGDNEERRRFARALVASNLAQPCPPTRALKPDVDAVVPVRDRPRQLHRLLRALTGLTDSEYVREAVVVDDASSDQDLTARVVEDGLGRLVRRAKWGGAAAARNSGAAATAAPFIAFLDSDCVPEDGWLAAVLPRSRVPFVPGAALVVRRTALGAGFDETLRGGEDVDFVWGLTEKGWHVRYEPEGRVQHEHRTSLGPWLSRRAHYGRTAAPLDSRHHAAARPLAVSPWTAAAWAAALLRQPFAASAITGTACTLLAGELSGVIECPVREAVRLAGGGLAKQGPHVADALNRTWWPATLAVAILTPRLRLPLAAAALAPALLEWRHLRPPLDPVLWTIARLLDDAAYGWGVWHGCWTQGEWGPLWPDLGWRLIIETGEELVMAAQSRQP